MTLDHSAADVEGERGFPSASRICVEQMQICVLLGLYDVASATCQKPWISQTVFRSAVPSHEGGNEHAQ